MWCGGGGDDGAAVWWPMETVERLAVEVGGGRWRHNITMEYDI